LELRDCDSLTSDVREQRGGTLSAASDKDLVSEPRLDLARGCFLHVDSLTNQHRAKRCCLVGANGDLEAVVANLARQLGHAAGGHEASTVENRDPVAQLESLLGAVC